MEKSAKQSLAIALAIFLVCILVRIVPAFLIYGTEDVWEWQFVRNVLAQGLNPYAQAYQFNWPPFIANAFSQLIDISGRFNIPYHGTVKIYPIVCDAIISVLIYNAFLNLKMGGKKAVAASLFYALNPLSIIVTSVHGNAAPLPVCFLVLAAYILYFYKGSFGLICSSLSLGFAISLKIWPVLFLPVMLQKARSWKGRLVYVFLSAIPVLAVYLPLYFQNKDVFIVRFLKYQGILTWWGLTGIFQVWNMPFLRSFSAFYIDKGIIVLGVVVLMMYILKTHRMGLFDGCLLVSLAAVFFATGFGPQYFMWILPFAIITQSRMLYPFTIYATTLLIIEYTLRPFNGTLGTFISTPPIPVLTPEQFMTDKIATNILRLPLWVFVGFWFVESAFSRNKRTEEVRK